MAALQQPPGDRLLVVLVLLWHEGKFLEDCSFARGGKDGGGKFSLAVTTSWTDSTFSLCFCYPCPCDNNYIVTTVLMCVNWTICYSFRVEHHFNFDTESKQSWLRVFLMQLLVKAFFSLTSKYIARQFYLLKVITKHVQHHKGFSPK